MSKPTVVSLFAGIGGIELGLERAGFQTAAQVELDPYCRDVLATHWPEVPRHDDVRTFPDWWGCQPRPTIDLVAGGFPCQPFSTAGRLRGIADERWGWPWMFDAIRAVRPRYVLVENVAALLRDRDAFGWMLGDLANFGFDAEWGVLSACALGAPHTRERLFLVAYPHSVDGKAGLGLGERRALFPRDLQEGAGPDPLDQLVAASRRSRRIADGVPDRLEPARIRGLGNAVVPAVAEHIGRLVMGHAQG